MNDVQDELERLKRQVEQLKKALEVRQQIQPSIANLPAPRDNLELVVDCARYAEGLVSEQSVRKKYGFSEETWEALGNDEQFIERIELEKVRRVRDGSFKREKAQQLIVKGPEILDGIATNPKANDKHKIDAVKALDALADPGAQAAHDDSDRVVVTITLTADEKITFSRPLRPTPNDDKTIDAVPGFMISPKDGNDGGQRL